MSSAGHCVDRVDENWSDVGLAEPVVSAVGVEVAVMIHPYGRRPVSANGKLSARVLLDHCRNKACDSIVSSGVEWYSMPVESDFV